MKIVLVLIVLVVSLLFVPFLFSIFSNPPEDLFGTLEPTTRTAALQADFVVNGLTVLQPVPDLALSLKPCTIYMGEGRFFAQADSLFGGVVSSFSLPVDATSSTSAFTWPKYWIPALELTNIEATVSIAVVASLYTFKINTASQGTLQYLFAQFGSHASDTTLFAGSYFRLVETGPSSLAGC